MNNTIGTLSSHLTESIAHLERVCVLSSAVESTLIGCDYVTVFVAYQLRFFVVHTVSCWLEQFKILLTSRLFSNGIARWQNRIRICQMCHEISLER